MSTSTKINLTQYMDNIAKIDGRFRFCTFQTYDGQRRHYICGHHEYCCTLGCCVSTAFSFYQLWYFWLLILLIILLCSGGGWWFRWRHGNFGNRSATPSRRRRHGGRGNGSRGSRVYPNNYYNQRNGNTCNLPPGYDKDPPSYNEVIAHLNQFPRADDRFRGGNPIEPTAPDMNQLLAVPPPSYQTVLDLQVGEEHISRDAPEPTEVEERGQGTINRIQSLLGRGRERRDSTQSLSPPMRPPPVASFPSAPLASSASSTSSSPTTSSGVFTISSESLPPIETSYPRTTNSERLRYLHPSPTHEPHVTRGVPSPTGSGSHSDYSSSYISPTSSVSRSTSGSFTPPQSPPSYSELPPSVSVSHTPDEPRADEMLEVGVGEIARPITGRSTLSRPTTSISTRSLPLPENIPRKPSIPGALEEWEDEEEEEEDELANSNNNITITTTNNDDDNNNSSSNNDNNTN